MADHRVDIVKACDECISGIRESFGTDPGGAWDDCFLEIEVFVSQSDRERRIVKFLLGCGGPTVRLKVDEYSNVTFFHSWGMSGGEDRTECSLRHADEDFVRTLAYKYCEIMPGA